VRFDYGRAVETDSQHTAYGYATMLVPDLPSDHDITAPLLDKSRTPLVLYDALSLSTLDTKRRTVEITPLLTSSAGAFLRVDLEDASTAKAASDFSGPLTLAVAVTDPSYVQNDEPQARMVLIGSGALLALSDRVPWNQDLFMNSLTWLEDRPENLTVRSKSLYLLPLRLNGLQPIIFGVLFVILIPVGFFVGGLVIWLRRRHL